MIGVDVQVPAPMAFYSFGGWKSSLFGDPSHPRAEGGEPLHLRHGGHDALAGGVRAAGAPPQPQALPDRALRRQRCTSRPPATATSGWPSPTSLGRAPSTTMPSVSRSRTTCSRAARRPAGTMGRSRTRPPCTRRSTFSTISACRTGHRRSAAGAHGGSRDPDGSRSSCWPGGVVRPAARRRRATTSRFLLPVPWPEAVETSTVLFSHGR